ncbi:MAG: hypothetical protein WBC73_15680 [Phormidesmis sp.]
MKMFLAGLAVIAAVVGAGIGYAGMKTTALPDWYAQDASADDEATILPVNEGYGSTSTEAIAPEDVVISAGELNQIVTEAIARQPYAEPLLNSSQGVGTSIEDGRIESGLVVNLSTLPVEALPSEGRQAVEQLTRTFPFVANRDVYVGIEGSPTVVDGSLSLDDTYLKLGQLRLPMDNVASQLGFSQGELESQLSAVLTQQGLTPEDVQVINGQLVIKGAAQ